MLVTYPSSFTSSIFSDMESMAMKHPIRRRVHVTRLICHINAHLHQPQHDRAGLSNIPTQHIGGSRFMTKATIIMGRRSSGHSL